jgi:hypothetical protein
MSEKLGRKLLTTTWRPPMAWVGRKKLNCCGNITLSVNPTSPFAGRGTCEEITTSEHSTYPQLQVPTSRF